MAIEFVCPACGGTLQVGDENAGRVIRCGGCLSALRVPGAEAAHSTASNPYEIDRPSQPSPPSRSEPLAAAVPVEPRRRRDPDEPPADRPRRRGAPDDSHDDRPRRRPPPPPEGRGVFIWLVIIGAVMLLSVGACCGGFFLFLPDAKWQKHESKDGGFRVELPGKAQPNAGKAAGIHLEKNTKSEGAVLIKRAEQFLVFYRDVPGTKERARKGPAEADDQLLKKEITAIRTATDSRGDPTRNEPITVSGFEGREIEFFGKGGWYTARVVVADTRVYVLLGGGGLAEQNDPDVRKFLDSFEITDKVLVAEGQRRAERAKEAKAAKEREEKRKAEEEEEQKRQETADLRSAAEAVAEAAIDAGLRAAPPPRRLPVAPAPRPVDD